MGKMVEKKGRIVGASHGLKDVMRDPDYEYGLAEFLKKEYSPDLLLELYTRFAHGDGKLDVLMRRALWRSQAKTFGNNVQIGSGVGFKHIETFEISDHVFIGADSYIQGRYDGTCIIGKYTWIGPKSYFDAREIVIGEYVGWGPGAMTLGSSHTGLPIDVPIIQTDLEIKPIRVGDWADIGTKAVLLPGVTIGKGAIVGAGAVVTKDVPQFAIVTGIPAKFLRWRDGYDAGIETDNGI